MDQTTVNRPRFFSYSLDQRHLAHEDSHRKVIHITPFHSNIIMENLRSKFIESPKPPVHYLTGSWYEGEWNGLGMSGLGDYKFPHGVIYKGNLNDGMFHGKGTFIYPMGQELEGVWVRGILTSFKYRFTDGLEYVIPWKYCQMPDRRYYESILNGLRPAGRSLLTKEEPPRKIPKGCYDTGDGFFNPKTKCVMSAIKPNKILRIPTTKEIVWIHENCRKAWDEPTGYKPEIYEHWVTGRLTDSVNNLWLVPDTDEKLEDMKTVIWGSPTSSSSSLTDW